jgi:hypothetical protein
VRAFGAKVVQEVGVVAGGVEEGVGEYEEAVEGAVLVDALSESEDG